ncbi:hypothetical protein AC579_6298 [Pseudocercospora musae]|uniref:Transcription factor domain-containing protein n=1 Tax=Pseudocercospora musae TaxID=113226 RepID=A0A139IPH2_9PEZI|nr:hypothetical protein AC579_6298 [Pseudocercospora musae]
MAGCWLLVAGCWTNHTLHKLSILTVVLLDGLSQVGPRLRASEAMQFLGRIDAARGLGAGRRHDARGKRKAWPGNGLSLGAARGLQRVFAAAEGKRYDWVSAVQIALVWTALRLARHHTHSHASMLSVPGPPVMTERWWMRLDESSLWSKMEQKRAAGSYEEAGNGRVAMRSGARQRKTSGMRWLMRERDARLERWQETGAVQVLHCPFAPCTAWYVFAMIAGASHIRWTREREVRGGVWCLSRCVKLSG